MPTTRYKLSKYNWSFDSDDGEGSYVFNGLSRALVALSSGETAQLRAVKDRSAVARIDPELRRQLVRGGFMIPEDEDEQARLKLRYETARFRAEALSLTVAPTLDCNMRCFYCFEGEKGRQSMSIETADKLLAFVDRYLRAHALRKVSLCWFGGEPLLALPVIERVNDGILGICDREGFEFESRAITNGALLDPAAARVLLRGNLSSLQITFDGPRSAHDRTRALEGGVGSFDLILERLAELHKAGLLKNVGIAFRVNVWRETADPVELDLLRRELIGLPWFDRSRMNIYLGHLKAYEERADDSRYLSPAEYVRLCQSFAASEGEEPKARNPYPRGASLCTAVRAHSFSIGPLGEITKCWVSFGEEEEVVGSIDDLLDTEESIPLLPEWIRWLTFNPADDPHCRGCKKLPLCMGGCPFFARGSRDTRHICHEGGVVAQLKRFLRSRDGVEAIGAVEGVV